MTGVTRRRFLQTGAAGVGGSVLFGTSARATGPGTRGAATRSVRLDAGWRFGGRYAPGSEQPGFDDSAFTRVTLPHTVTDLSWRQWDPATWQDRWIYRRQVDVPPELMRYRLFLDFQAAQTVATPVLNGRELPAHTGGYLPFSREVTDRLAPAGNALAVVVDARWLQVPPAGAPEGPGGPDFLQPGGIVRGVALRAVPQVFISDVFARPVAVLSAERRLDVTCTLDAAVVPDRPVRVEAVLRDGTRRVAQDSIAVQVAAPGETTVDLTLGDLGDVALWDVDDPHLYELEVRLVVAGQPVHEHRTRTGLREARFETDGFFLNGRRLKVFGLNRHELYPYVGFSMPDRVVRRDAQILRHELNCTMVRCSHYPQSPAFLDACDEFGLMVWEELPGWHYIGDQAWQDLAVADVEAMVRRDRSRPSVVIWGLRINESVDNTDFYTRTEETAKRLDGTRATSGAANGDRYTTQNYQHDVFAFNDYSGTTTLRPPRTDRPYLLTEAVGQFPRFRQFYRRIDTGAIQQQQAVLHAEVHNLVASDIRYCGLLAWVAFDYTSLKPNTYQGLKWSGVADTFRVPKPGAAIYRSQVDPGVRAVIAPAFYWHFGDAMPDGPGDGAMIASNCDRLEVSVDGRPYATVTPDRQRFPYLRYAPSFVDLGGVTGAGRAELRIDGYVGNRLVASRRFASDPSGDVLSLVADDDVLDGDGSDATRLVFRAVDRYGEPRPYAGGTVTLEVTGPARLVGDNPFPFGDTGGVGAVWLRSTVGGVGTVRVTATHPVLGTAASVLKVRPDPAGAGS